MAHTIGVPYPMINLIFYLHLKLMFMVHVGKCSSFWLILWVFPKIGLPQNGWFIMENPYFLMDDLGGKPTILGNPLMAMETNHCTVGTHHFMASLRAVAASASEADPIAWWTVTS